MTRLPHEADKRYLVWTGMETDLIFNRGVELPAFASFPLLERSETRAMLKAYARDQIALAARYGLGTVLESATWLANRDRAEPLGYSACDLVSVNRDAVDLLATVRDECNVPDTLVSANIGPRRDAYAPGDAMSPAEAEEYHGAQVRSLAGTRIDMISPYTFGNTGEAIGVVRAAAKAGLACVVAFTVETDGRLPSGQSLDDAIAQTDRETGAASSYFMVNCAHPEHFATTMPDSDRIGGIVVNASRCSHAELDEATSLDDGDPAELGRQVASLIGSHPWIRVFGGCCGTDMRHLEAMAANVRSLP